MSQDRFQQVMALFEEALPLAREELGEFLDRRCEGDESLRAEVEALLVHDAKPSASLKGAGGGVKLLAERVAPRVIALEDGPRMLPTLSGQYRVIRIVGEGGMGTVYEAEQARPRRTVALKAIRPGLVSRQMLARLEREAEVLGRLQHPGIAQVYEAGAADPTREDQAFFAMEFVRGQPLTAHCEQHRLDVRQRLALVAKVCDAVQHAHERRVVHRDLKPGNILVDEAGQPKVLDFGVARALDAEQGGATLHTVAGQLVGTLPYMSPEQVGADSSAVDARSDVYALGVILYQLGTGKLPHDLTGLSIPESARVIRDETPVRPGAINAKLKGDVETIICKALEKDRGRRYQSAAALGEDIRRLLTGHPIAAKEDSAFYVLSKQVKRHRAAVSLAAGVFIAISAFAVYSAAQSRKNARLAADERIARGEADAARRASERQLRSSNIERGRLMGMTGNLAGAEELIWGAHRQEATEQSRWALWELYSQHPCVMALQGHNTPVRAVAMSPSGEQIVSTALESQIRVWDAKSGVLVRTIDTGAVSIAMGFVPRSGTLLSVGFDGKLREWNTGTGELLRALAIPGGRALGVLVLGETGLVAVTSDDGKARVVSLEKWAIERELPGSKKVIRAMAYAKGGTLLAGTGDEGRVFFWRPATGELLTSFVAHDGPISAISMRDDAGMMATGGPDKVLKLWEISGELTPSKPVELAWDNGWVRSLAFTRDGTQLLATGFWRVEVWDVAKRALAANATLVEQPPYIAAMSPDESLIITGAENGMVRVWEKQSLGALRRTAASPGGVSALAITRDGKMAAASGTVDGVIHVYEVGEKGLTALAALTGHKGRVPGLAFAPDGGSLASCGHDGTVRFWAPSGGESRGFATLPATGENIVSVNFSGDGSAVAWSTREGAIKLLRRDSASPQVIAKAIGNPYEVLRVSFNEAGTSLAATRRVKWLEFYDASTGALQWKGEADAPVWSIEFLKGTDLFAVGTWDSGIEVWSESKRARVSKLSGHTQVVSALAWKPADASGAAMLASGSSDGTVKLWSIEEGVCLATLRPEGGAVTGVAFVPGAAVLLSSHADGTVGRWDLGYYERHIGALGTWAAGGAREGVAPQSRGGGS